MATTVVVVLIQAVSDSVNDRAPAKRWAPGGNQGISISVTSAFV
jgi:hypothetical protein